MALNLANRISLLRLALVPIFVASLLKYTQAGEEIYRALALAIFLLAVVSDFIDGYVARVKNQKTILGTFLDPLGDKFLLNSAIIILSLSTSGLQRLPIWLTVAVISRDAVIVVGFLLVHLIHGHIEIIPSNIGKAAAVSQMVLVIWVLCGVPAPYIMWKITGFLTIVSGLSYAYRGAKLFGENAS
ncbi:MAG: CDP-alcohol phosphatidyltransferase family protein [Candidatus Tritonobacter lacicola]|nr:CDP-alcohol phosphatidyltransferase family protein [Candidatus Tritonobacter lacicola]